MKINRIGCLLFVVIFLVAALLIVNFDGVSNKVKEIGTVLFAMSKSDEKIKGPPLPKIPLKPDVNQINQLLQQKVLQEMNRQPVYRNSNNPDDLSMLKEALNALYSAEDAQDRELAVMILGEFTDQKAKEGIIDALKDPDALVREQAVSQIDEWSDQNERTQMLLMALNNDFPDIVVYTLESISEIDDPFLLERLKTLSEDKNEDVREAARAALDLAED